MALIAKKPCSFGGENFFIGDEIPADLVNDPSYQEQIGVLSSVDEPSCITGTGNGTLSIPIIKDADADTAEVLEIKLSEGAVQEVFAILQMDEEHAVEAIGRIENESELIAVHACDSREACKTAAKSRSESLANTLSNKPIPNDARTYKSSTKASKKSK